MGPALDQCSGDEEDPGLVPALTKTLALWDRPFTNGVNHKQSSFDQVAIAGGR